MLGLTLVFLGIWAVCFIIRWVLEERASGQLQLILHCREAELGNAKLRYEEEFGEKVSYLDVLENEWILDFITVYLSENRDSIGE